MRRLSLPIKYSPNPFYARQLYYSYQYAPADTVPDMIEGLEEGQRITTRPALNKHRY